MGRKPTTGFVIVITGISGGTSGNQGKSCGQGALALPRRSCGAHLLGSRTSCEVSSGDGATAHHCATAARLAFRRGTLAAPTPRGARPWLPPEPRLGPQQQCFLGALSCDAWRSGCRPLNPTPRLSPRTEVRRGPGTCEPWTWTTSRRDDPGAICWVMGAFGASMGVPRTRPWQEMRGELGANPPTTCLLLC